jgi:hypothetical protein
MRPHLFGRNLSGERRIARHLHAFVENASWSTGQGASARGTRDRDLCPQWSGRDVVRRAIGAPLTVQADDDRYIPAGVPHLPYNSGPDEAFAVLSRTDPNEQESVISRPDLDKVAPSPCLGSIAATI